MPRTRPRPDTTRPRPKNLALRLCWPRGLNILADQCCIIFRLKCQTNKQQTVCSPCVVLLHLETSIIGWRNSDECWIRRWRWFCSSARQLKNLQRFENLSFFTSQPLTNCRNLFGYLSCCLCCMFFNIHTSRICACYFPDKSKICGLIFSITDLLFGMLMLLCSVVVVVHGPDYKKILRLSYDVIITYDNRKSNLR